LRMKPTLDKSYSPCSEGYSRVPTRSHELFPWWIQAESHRREPISVQMVQVIWQVPQLACVTIDLRDSPVASSDRPPVSTAPVALPPLMPFLVLTWIVETLPFVWQ
jgi:hypothetical protein